MDGLIQVINNGDGKNQSKVVLTDRGRGLIGSPEGADSRGVVGAQVRSFVRENPVC